MPLGKQLSKLFNPGPAKDYDPNREALFAQLLSSGAAPTNDIGSAIGGLAKFFVGSRGLKKQGQARDIEMGEQAAMEAEEQARQDQALAEQLAEWGVNPNLPQDSPVFGEAMRRSRPQAPPPPKDRKRSKGPRGEARFEDTGELVYKKEVEEKWAREAAEAEKVAAGEARNLEVSKQYLAQMTGQGNLTDDQAKYLMNNKGVRDFLAKKAHPEEAPKAELPKAPPGYRWTEDGSGNLEPIQGGPAAKVAESQQRATEAAVRVGEGLDVLQAPTENGERRFEVLAGLTENVIGSVPGGNYKLSADYQMASQAMSDIASSLLRMETGAAAKEEERLDVIARYSPRPGDKPPVIEQKMNGLMTRYENAKHLAGPTFGLRTEEPAPTDLSGLSNDELLKELGL